MTYSNQYSYLVWLVSFAAWPTAGCSASPSPTSNGSTAGSDGGTSNQETQGSGLRLEGDWLFCDKLEEANGLRVSSYLDYGGTRLHLAMEAGLLVARKLDNVGQPTTTFITGPLDVMTRQWTADLMWSHIEDGGWTNWFSRGVQIVFNADGTRFDGSGISAETGKPGSWAGGRVDGTFICTP